MEREQVTARAFRLPTLSVGVVAFVLLAFLLSWGAWVGLKPLGVPLTERTWIAMTGPMLAALIARGRVTRERLRLAGRNLYHAIRRAHHCIVAFVAIPVLLTIGVALSMLVGITHAAVAEESGFRTELAFALSLGLLVNSVIAFAEEFGWRGYLFAELRSMGAAKASLVTGVIWSVWHAPAILLDGFNFPTHRIMGLLLMAALAVPFSVILTWLRMRSEGLLAPALAHGAFNAQAGVALLFVPQGSVLAAPVGILGAIPFMLFAAWLLLSGSLSPAGAPAPAMRLAARVRICFDRFERRTEKLAYARLGAVLGIK